jgi:hypothetical protein
MWAIWAMWAKFVGNVGMWAKFVGNVGKKISGGGSPFQ